MKRMPSVGLWSVALVLGLGALGCQPGGVGDPCTPEDEYQQRFNGFQVTETNVESRSFQCETRLCLVNHFQGRVSCRLGQAAPPLDADGKPVAGAGYTPSCSIPGTKATTDVASLNNVNVEVPAQLTARQTDKAVYCSCRCDGPDKNARYCECPEGFSCTKLVDELKITNGAGQLAGSYCIRSGTAYEEDSYGTETCRDSPTKCGCDGANPSEECGTKL
jgi:hypothetical protein